MIPVLLALLLSGCVVAVSDAFCVDEPVSEVFIDLQNANLTVSSAPRLCVDVSLEGMAVAPLAYGVEGDTLLIQGDCSACSGEVEVTAPRGLLVDVVLARGDLHLAGRGGDVYASVGAGDITAEDLVSDRTELASGEGKIQAAWSERPLWIGAATTQGRINLTVPTGVYSLDLTADSGSVDVSGIESSVAADAQIGAVAQRGSIVVRGR
jgi:hypothetical protein